MNKDAAALFDRADTAERAPLAGVVEIVWRVGPASLELVREPTVRRWLAEGLAYCDIGVNEAQMRDGLARGRYALGLVFSGERRLAALVIEQEHVGVSGAKVLSILTCGGVDLVDWMRPLNSALLGLARGIGAERLVVIGRPGWMRTLQGIGWERVAVVMQRRIESAD